MRCPDCVNGLTADNKGNAGICSRCAGTGVFRTLWRATEKKDNVTTDEQLADAAEIVSALRRIPRERRFDALVVALKVFVEHPEKIDRLDNPVDKQVHKLSCAIFDCMRQGVAADRARCDCGAALGGT